MSDRTETARPAAAAPRSKWAASRRILKLIFTPVAVVLAILYFLIDAIALSLVRPLARRIAGWPPIARLMAWIATLGPYPTLALLLVPVVVLEPLKPLAFYLMTKRHQAVVGTVLLAMTEIVKIVAVERLFRVCHAKLMTIPAFARVYTFTVRWLAYLEALPPWQLALRMLDWGKALSRRVIALARGLADQ